MNTRSLPPAEIRPAKPAERAEALEILMPGLSGGPREAALESLANQADSLLLAAYRSERIVGAIWLDPKEGGTTFLTGPQIVAEEPESTRTELLRRSLDWLDEHSPMIAQGLTESDESPTALALRGEGFEEAAVLLYLVSLKESFPSAEPGDLALEEVEEKDFARLEAVVEKTYIGTLDCAAVRDDSSPEESIRGYLTTGSSANRWWRFLREGDQDIGCLLLGDFPTFGQLELIYVGLIPAARGRGLGGKLVRWAQWLAGNLGRQRLTLAVDEANGPAVAMYAATDFHVCQRRHVWLRKGKGK